jgi:hypothetical protein
LDENPLVHRRYDAGIEHPVSQAVAMSNGQMLLSFVGLGILLIGVMGYWASKKPPDTPEC